MRTFKGFNDLKDDEYIFTPRDGGVVFTKSELIKEQLHNRKYIWNDTDFKVVSLKEITADPLFRYYTHHIDTYYEDIKSINRVFENNISSFTSFKDFRVELEDEGVAANLLRMILRGEKNE